MKFFFKKEKKWFLKIFLKNQQDFVQVKPLILLNKLKYNKN